MTQLYLIRHGETPWSRSGQHTSVTDLDLTERGVAEAEALRGRLDPAEFGLVLSSPRRRALRTAEIVGFDDPIVDEDLAEWGYGPFEGRTSDDIRTEHPGWRIWTQPIPGGESAEHVMARLNRVVGRVRESGVEKAVCFGHGHALRVLALCWLGFPIERGESLPLKTASLSILGQEKESWAIRQWNA